LSVLGTTDKSKAFHPYAVMLNKSEDQEDFAYFFETIQTVKPTFKPTVLLADAAASITNGFVQVFNSPQRRVTCWAHVIRAIRKQQTKLRLKKEIKELIQLDIINFARYVCEDNFIHVAQLMCKSWQTKFQETVHGSKTTIRSVSEFIRYFSKWWLAPSRNGWYDNFAKHVPCHNNALESTNKYIKQKSIYKNRQSIMEFVNSLDSGFLYYWSVLRSPTYTVERGGEKRLEPNPNFKTFQKHPIITFDDFKVAHQWSTLKKKFTKVKFENRVLYFVRSSDKNQELLQEEECIAFLNTPSSSFDSFVSFLKHYTKIYVLEIDSVDFLLSTCSCNKWSKDYKCKHIITLLVSRAYLNTPIEAMDIKFGENRRRGRPRLNVHCLMKQPEECITDIVEYVESDTDTESNIQPVKKKKELKRTAELEEEEEYDIFQQVPEILEAPKTPKSAPVQKRATRSSKKQ